jgi:transposase
MTTAPEYIGIDVAKATLVVGTSSRVLCEVANTPAGFRQLITKLSSLKVACVVLEATGIYSQAVCAALMEAGYAVALVQPGCVRHFAKSQCLHAKTDAIDAMMIARFGASQQPRIMEITPAEISRLRLLVDRRDQLIELRKMEQNHLEACRDRELQKEMKQAIKRFEQQEKAYDKKIAQALSASTALQTKRKILENESGIGTQTAAVLLAHLPELGHLNRQQISALAGLAPYNNDSGTKRGKRTIFGGRKRVREALYMATLSAVRFNQTLNAYYVNLLKRGKCKMVAQIACARKLIIRLNTLLAEHHKKPQETTQTA